MYYKPFKFEERQEKKLQISCSLAFAV